MSSDVTIAGEIKIITQKRFHMETDEATQTLRRCEQVYYSHSEALGGTARQMPKPVPEAQAKGGACGFVFHCG